MSYDQDQGTSKWKTQYIGAWLKTTGGTIASREGFDAGDPPPENLKNAEFLILSGKSMAGPQPEDGAIRNFVSKCERELNDKKTCKNFGIGVNPLQRIRSGALTLGKVEKIEITLTRGSESTPTKRKRLQTKGAFIDIDALTTGPATESTKSDLKKNQFGKKVQKHTNVVTPNPPFESTPEGRLYNDLRDGRLGGIVTVINGDLVIGNTADGWEIANGTVDSSNKPISGGRTIVVKGNLIIKRPITYQSQTAVMTNLKQLASIGWIVLEKDSPAASPDRPSDIPLADWNKGGNIVIDDCIPPSNSVKGYAEISGLFFAEGKVLTGTGKTASCRAVFDQYADMLPKNAWIKNVAADISLVVNGAMIAKGYGLQRVYGGFNNGSESILNDGRMLVSVPPGLEDFMKSFPSF